MKLSAKVLLYSGLVFPGAGYFVLEKMYRGGVALITTIGCLVFIMSDVFHRASIIAEKIVQGDIPYDISIVREQILRTPGELSDGTISMLSITIGMVWLISLVDGYYLAVRKADDQE